MDASQFSGEWTSTYSYHNGIDMSQHVVNFIVTGTTLSGSSLAQPDGSELSVSLQYDSERKLLTGTWQETTSKTGHFKGAVFYGAMQLIVNAKGTKAVGKWVGHSSDYSRINSGGWRLEKNS